MIPLNTSDGGVAFAVSVQPRAKRDEITGTIEDALKVRITASPVDGAANRHLVRFFAKILGVPKSRVRIVSGERSRKKIVRVEGKGEAAVLASIEKAMG